MHIVIPGATLGWKEEEEVALGAPLPAPSKHVPQACSSCHPPLSLGGDADSVVEAGFPAGCLIPLHIILAAFLQPEPCKRLLPRSGVGANGICYRRGDLAGELLG